MDIQHSCLSKEEGLEGGNYRGVGGGDFMVPLFMFRRLFHLASRNAVDALVSPLFFSL
jgi:hypothetical protein